MQRTTISRLPMSHQPSSQDDAEHRVIPLRKGVRTRDAGAPEQDADLSQYHQSEEPDDYRQRMIANVAGLAVVILLIAIGVWIADTMASMQKNQDCVLYGRRGCTPVEAPPQQRW